MAKFLRAAPFSAAATIIGSATLLLTTAPALAQDTATQARIPVIQQLYDCRALTDSVARLACFDRQVAALEQADNARDIRIADRGQVREARRGLFGFSLRNLNIFGGGNDGEAEDTSDPDVVQEITATLSDVDRNGLGRLIFTLDNGQRWIQSEAAGGGRTPHVGQSIIIRRAALGSFMASVEGRAGLRVRREQ